MNDDTNNIEKILKIYKIYSDDNQKYNTIIWQFPTALITVNILAINFFLNNLPSHHLFNRFFAIFLIISP
jgi:hypothetical protein